MPKKVTIQIRAIIYHIKKKLVIPQRNVTKSINKITQPKLV